MGQKEDDAYIQAGNLFIGICDDTRDDPLVSLDEIDAKLGLGALVTDLEQYVNFDEDEEEEEEEETPNQPNGCAVASLMLIGGGLLGLAEIGYQLIHWLA